MHEHAFRNKLLLSLSGRIDGSSRFPQDRKYGVFPAGSVGYVLTEEGFLKDNSVVSLLKVRGSYGTTGNAEIGNFSNQRLFSALPYADHASQVGLGGTMPQPHRPQNRARIDWRPPWRPA